MFCWFYTPKSPPAEWHYVVQANWRPSPRCYLVKDKVILEPDVFCSHLQSGEIACMLLVCWIYIIICIYIYIISVYTLYLYIHVCILWFTSAFHCSSLLIVVSDVSWGIEESKTSAKSFQVDAKKHPPRSSWIWYLQLRPAAAWFPRSCQGTNRPRIQQQHCFLALLACLFKFSTVFDHKSTAMFMNPCFKTNQIPDLPLCHSPHDYVSQAKWHLESNMGCFRRVSESSFCKISACESVKVFLKLSRAERYEFLGVFGSSVDWHQQKLPTIGSSVEDFTIPSIVKKISCTLDKHTMESNRHLQVGFVHDWLTLPLNQCWICIIYKHIWFIHGRYLWGSFARNPIQKKWAVWWLTLGP